MNSGEPVFKMYLSKLVEDTKRAENDEEFRSTMNLLYSQMAEPSQQEMPEEESMGFQVEKLKEVEETSALIGLTRKVFFIDDNF